MRESLLTQSTDADVRPLAATEFQSVLVPLDLTPISDRVLGRVPTLPLAAGARVTLLHVADRQAAARDAENALADEARHLQRALHESVSVEPRVKVGAASKEKAIAACAAETNATMIVMGRGGGRVLRDLFMGSTAERVLRQAQRPVLVIRRPARDAYARPALALNLDHAAELAVRFMLAMVPRPRQRVKVIHAVPYQSPIYPSLSLSTEEIEGRKSELRSEATHKLRELLASASKQLKLTTSHPPSWKTHVIYGPPRVVVERAIRHAEPDLLVLGTSARRGAANLLFGTIAGDLLRAVSCDVLLVPAPRGARTGDAVS